MKTSTIVLLAGFVAFGFSGAAYAASNPASEYCKAQGGRVEISQDAKGNEVGLCYLPDGSMMEEWALYRSHGAKRNPNIIGRSGDPASVFCKQQGGRVKTRKDDGGNEIGLCYLPDGSMEETWSFYRLHHGKHPIGSGN